MNLRSAENAAARFNKLYPVGTLVRFWPGKKEGAGHLGIVRQPASILGGHTAVAWIQGQAACVSVTHVARANQ